MGDRIAFSDPKAPEAWTPSWPKIGPPTTLADTWLKHDRDNCHTVVTKQAFCATRTQQSSP